MNSKENDSENAKSTPGSVKKHACSYVGCNYSFDRPWKLETHLNTHTNQRPFKCDSSGCSKSYTSNSHLQRHKSVSHGKNKLPPEQIPCSYPECNKVFANKWGMKRHYASHQVVGPYKCVVCGESFKKYKELKNHMYAHWGLDLFVCEKCKESFKTRVELRRHERTHKVYFCEYAECKEEFNSWNALRAHLKCAHPNRYQCDFCKNYYKNKWTMTEHVLSHLPFDKRNIIICPYEECKRYYFYERNLEAHIKSFHHDINFTCEIEGCGKIFTTKMRLKDHLKRHSEPKKEKTVKKPRALRKDKGLSKKSMAATLSGIMLPDNINKSIAQGIISSEVETYIENLKTAFLEEKNSDNVKTSEKGTDVNT